MKYTLYDFLEEENKIYAEYREENSRNFSYIEVTQEEKENLEKGNTMTFIRDDKTIILKV